MTTLQMILQPIIGAIIGFFTNWIAIKMLFRPYTEKKLFGVIKIPFTPGLIPSERKALAKKVGQVTSAYVLTEDVLKSSLNSNEIHEKINNLVLDFFNEISTQDITILEKLNQIFPNTAESNIESVKEKIKELIKSKAVKDMLRDTFEKSDIISNINEMIKNLVEDNLALLQEDSKKVSDFVPIKYVEAGKSIIDKNIGVIIAYFIKLYKNNPSLNDSVRNMFYNIIIENFGKFIGGIVGKEKIFNSITNNIFEYLENIENQNRISSYLQKYIDDLTNIETQTIIEKSTMIIEKYNLEDTKTNLITKLTNYIKDEKKLKELAYVFVDKFIENICDIVLNLKINLLYNKLVLGREHIFINFVSNFIQAVILKGSDIVIKNFNIEKIIEDRINEFEVDEAEKIIVSVVSKELNAITWLGGLLGLIIGLVPVIIDLLN